MPMPTDAEKNQAIRDFLTATCHGRLAKLWTATGPSETAVDYIDNGSPLSHGESIILKVAFDVWNGRGKATVDDLLSVLDDGNLRAVLLLIGVARPDAAP